MSCTFYSIGACRRAAFANLCPSPQFLAEGCTATVLEDGEREWTDLEWRNGEWTQVRRYPARTTQRLASNIV